MRFLIAILAFLMSLSTFASAATTNVTSVALTNYSKYWNGTVGAQFYGTSDSFAVDVNSGDIVIYDYRQKTPVEAQRVKMAEGMYATNALLRGTNVHVTGRFNLPGGRVEDGFQTWNLSLTDPKAHPALVQTYHLGMAGDHAQYLTSLSGSLDVVYLTSYIIDSVFVETPRIHTVQAGETVWSITRDEICGGNTSCAFAAWRDILELNSWIPTCVTGDGVTIALIYPGDEITVAPSQYATVYTSTVRKIRLIGANSPAMELGQLTWRGLKFELSYPDPTVSAQNLWATDDMGRDRMFQLNPTTLQINKEIKAD